MMFMMAAAILWHVVAIADMPKNKHTHVEVTGYVTRVRLEQDGDLHVRICDSPKVKGMDRKHCVVGELIESNPVKLPGFPYNTGDLIQMRGISRFDYEGNHNWWEVHPVVEMRKVPAR